MLPTGSLPRADDDALGRIGGHRILVAQTADVDDPGTVRHWSRCPNPLAMIVPCSLGAHDVGTVGVGAVAAVAFVAAVPLEMQQHQIERFPYRSSCVVDSVADLVPLVGHQED